jgi:cobalamin transport system substrate-binding protein
LSFSLSLRLRDCARNGGAGFSVSYRRSWRCLLVLGLTAALISAAPPRRIIAASPAVSDILYGIGAFDNVVAVTEYCVYPPEAKRLPKVGGWSTPSIERIAGFHPDLVAFSDAQAPFLKSPLEQLGIRTAMAPGGTIQDAFAAIAELGKATGHEGQAAELAERTRSALEVVRKRAAGLPHPSVLVVVDRTPGTLREMYAAREGSFLAELVEIAGGTVVAGPSGPGYGKISAETVMTENPDIILDLMSSNGNSGPDPAAAWRELPELKAVRRGNVHVVREEFVPHDSQMIAKTAVLFARLLHPEVPAADWEAH